MMVLRKEKQHCGSCKELRELNEWIYQKNSKGKKIMGAQFRVCALCFEDSKK